MASTPSLRELFEAALPLPAAARAQLLAERCPDPLRRAQIERMLAADAMGDDLLPTGDAARAARVIGDASIADALPAGSCIGPFTLVEILGEGGSSTVFRAFRQADGVRQEVAIKLLARGLYTVDAQRQFRREREALARLRHPGIARLIEGGITDGGLAYIALELVDGVPITRYACGHGLDLRQRLVLFLMVCRAVETAHRALIVHRDLKPSNVLVTPEGDVKLLDFGIAKLLDEDVTGAIRTQHRALTPAYAAPEQFAQQPITTSTDVYALGILLDELITGRRRATGDTTTPSSRIDSGSVATAYGVAHAPASVRPLRRKLRGDLDNIVLKAVAIEPERRYASAGALAEDIERHLDRQPVSAHPPSRWYRTSKFVDRHRGGVVATAVFMLAILVSLSIALWQAHVAREQAARADMARTFVESLFAPIRYGVAATKQPSLDELLAHGVAKLDNSPQMDDGSRVDLLAMFSRLYENLGDAAQSRRLANRAVALSERALAPSDIEAIRALTARGYAEVRAEDYAAGGADLRLAHRRLLAQGIHGEALVDLIGPLGAVENSEGHGEAALDLAREALAERIATWGPDDPRVGIGYNDVASALEGLERYDEAIGMWRKTWQFELAHFGSSSNESTLALAGWASSAYRAGHWTQAHALFAKALAMYARNGGRLQLTQVYAAQKACVLEGLRADRASAQARCRQAQAWSAGGFGADSALHGDSLEATAFGEVEAGDLAGARKLFEAARQRYGSDPANRMRIGRVDSELAGIALLEGQPALARALLPEAIAGLRTRKYRMPPLIAEARLLLACSRSPGPQCPQALQATVDRDLAAVASRSDPQLLWVHTLLAQVELEHGEAGRARARLAVAIPRASHELPAAHPRRLAAQLWLAVAAARSGDCAYATAQTKAVRAITEAADLASHPELASASALLRRPIASCRALLN
ncbi:serine/threonine-protein kinase [Rhodanobacter sp. T12-5]|uniref:serine/threonine-protein kinase n=1 Tax=Rhodanobacter sp. T12-5 TaxID=2024611 RepID=UPI0011EF5E4C|nr:serine/threonine-protein kinase [Rhodanobacter sp. T12-5]KAA0068307.1 serine/threonine protein kinase [Rhodanobacter sp. T12-5]